MPDKSSDAEAPLSPTASGDQDRKGRVVVTLSSVAKMAPPANRGTNAAPLQVPALAESSLKAGRTGHHPENATVAPPLNRPSSNRITEVQLPPKSGVLPKLTKLSGAPLHAPALRSGAAPPSAPVLATDLKSAPQPKRTPAFRLQPFRPDPSDTALTPVNPPAPPGWKHMVPGELRNAPASPQAGETPAAEGPPHLSPKADTLHVAPPLLGSPANEVTEKLRLPPPLRKTETEPVPSLAKAPALIESAAGSLLVAPASGEPTVSPVHKAPALSAPATGRRLAPPLGAPSKETGPPALPHAATNPPPLPKKLVSALQKPPELKESLPPLSPTLPDPAMEEKTTLKSKLKPLDSGSSFLEQGELLILAPGTSDLASASPPILSKEEQFPPAFVSPVAPSLPPHLPVSPKSNPVSEAVPPPLEKREALLPSPASKEPASPLARKMEPATSIAPLAKTPSPAASAEPVASTLIAAGAAAAAKKSPAASSKSSLAPSPDLSTPAAPSSPPPPRSARLRKKQLVGTIAFWVIFLLFLPFLYILGLQFTSETSVRGQVIPPPGTLVTDEVWVVSDFRELAAGVADDLAAERAPKLQEIQERQDHVQRAQADIAAREERIRLLKDQMTGAKDEIGSIIKQARDNAQKVWDGPGAGLEDEYKNRLAQLQQSIAARAKSLNLKYTPDNTYQSPEVWANAYRLALYQTPPGVDGAKEHTWIEAQLVQWRAFTKTFDDRKDKLRVQAAQIQLAPTARVNDLNGQIDDLQHRVDSTQAEEEPLKTELQQARTDLAQSQAAEAHLDDAYYQQLYKLPEQSLTKRLPMRPDGRFDWTHLEKDSAFSSSEKSHTYWIFSRAVRKDGRQYWMLDHFSISQNANLAIVIEPGSFISTKAILRPDLSADDQQE